MGGYAAKGTPLKPGLTKGGAAKGGAAGPYGASKGYSAYAGKANGKSKDSRAAPSLEALQQQVQMHADALMDMNTYDHDLRQQLESILGLRAQMLAGPVSQSGGLVREPVQREKKPASANVGPLGINFQWVHITSINWKNILQEHIIRELG